MQFSTGISRNTQSNLYMLSFFFITLLSLTECVWNFRNNALRDTHYRALLVLRIHLHHTCFVVQRFCFGIECSGSLERTARLSSKAVDYNS